ncbi:MAG: gas vesicle protein GvpJ [Pseudomonadota bacterium]
MADFSIEETEHISLCETLDRILNKGAVVFGEVVVSVANVDLIYIALQLVVGSLDTIHGGIPVNGSNSPPIRLGIRADNAGNLRIDS